MSDTRKRMLFIVNPVSGKGTAETLIPFINKYFDTSQFEIFIETSKGSGHAAEIAAESKTMGLDAMIAVGGDGTVNEVGRELVHSDVALGILPMGSGNGLARHMKIPLEIEKSLSCIRDMNCSTIDTALLDNRRFLNVAGVGFDASVSWEFAGSERRGLIKYISIIIRLLSKMEDSYYDIHSKEFIGGENAVMLSFANSSQFGNDARIAPSADIRDGKVDICILRKVGVIQITRFALNVMRGSIRNSSYFQTFTSDFITVKGGNGKAHIDGEPVEVSQKFTVKSDPLSLKIICPK